MINPCIPKEITAIRLNGIYHHGVSFDLAARRQKDGSYKIYAGNFSTPNHHIKFMNKQSQDIELLPIGAFAQPQQNEAQDSLTRMQEAILHMASSSAATLSPS